LHAPLKHPWTAPHEPHDVPHILPHERAALVHESWQSAGATQRPSAAQAEPAAHAHTPPHPSSHRVPSHLGTQRHLPWTQALVSPQVPHDFPQTSPHSEPTPLQVSVQLASATHSFEAFAMVPDGHAQVPPQPSLPACLASQCGWQTQ
jgi:hypothetical protein